MMWRKAGRFLLLLGGIVLLWPKAPAQAAPTKGMLVGQVLDAQGQPVEGARVWLGVQAEDAQVLAETETQADGSFALRLPESVIYGAEAQAPKGQVALSFWQAVPPGTGLSLRVTRAHFESGVFPLSGEQVQALRNGETVELPPISLERHIGLAFFVALLVFVGMMVGLVRLWLLFRRVAG